MKEWIRWVLILPLVFVVILAGVWFAYPRLNPDEKGSADGESELLAGSETEETILIDGEGSPDPSSESAREALGDHERRFLVRIDSLEEENRFLTEEVQRLESELESGEDEDLAATLESKPDESFQEQIKSLLNLDEREMGPILERLNQDQLIRIYKEAGNMQREKILRSLSTDRSAQLITEVM